MYDCPRCHDQGGWCEACGGTSSSEALFGVAESRGMFWAEHVARVMIDREFATRPGVRRLAPRARNRVATNREPRRRRAHA